MDIATLEIFLGLLMTALVIALAAKRFDLPYPIALVVGGIAVALVPGVPRVRLDPNVVFFLLLPPVLFEAAYFTSWRDFWRWRRSIALLAFGLVAVTSGLVAAVCVALIPGMTWATGFILGAIVSPPDAAAATSIMRGLQLPRRVVQILEGESLVNDAGALTLYRFAVAAVVTGAFSFAQASATFLWIAGGGTALGVAVGYGFVKLFPKLKDPDVEIISTFLLAYVSYLIAETLHASGVMATVAAGLMVGWRAPQIFSATTRIRGVAVWQTAIFFINVVIFLLIGLQLPLIFETLRRHPPMQVAMWCAAVSLCVIVVRIVWAYAGAYIPRRLSKKIRESEPEPTLDGVLVVGWTGLRGVVSLAAALALPVTTANGEPFPNRDIIELLTFAVILSTLLVQGLTLRPLIARLNLPEDRANEEERLKASIFAVERALDRMSELERESAAPENILYRVRSFFEDRLSDLRAQLELEIGADALELPEEFQTIAEQRIWWELAQAEREAVIELRRRQSISDEAMREIEREIDLLEARIVPHG